MAGITLAQAEAKLAEYLAAETAVLAGQRVTIDNVTLDRSQLDAIQTGIDIWNGRVQQLAGSATNGGRMVRRIVPIT